ncbi:MAG: glutamate--tRNA ligase [Oscillibacter sp.]|jgi:glutamyl-tRNA synthetase|nr:glutamate--tRNA ligase [Oscillibacter sp.]
MALDMKFFSELEERIPKGTVRTRFAPSPTGYMHVGNLRTALYTWLIARSHGGTFILRIEDTDQSRLVPGAVDVIYKTLQECGLTHDEGPDVGGPVGPYVQTERRGLYGKYAELLLEKGAAYRCFCGREDEEDVDVGEGVTIHRHHCGCAELSPEEIAEKLAARTPCVIRQKIPRTGKTTFHDVTFGDITVENEDLDDQVLLKSDGLPTYNFANVVDDHLMGITHVVRGSEYLSSAPKYNLLYQAFGWEIPTYVHCSPVMRDAHNKMSKRHGDPSYEDLVAQGYLTPAILNYVALLGWAPRGELAEQEIFSLPELVRAFDIAGISKSPAIFDMAKLDYFNATYLRALPAEEFARVAEPYIRRAVKNPETDVSLIAALLQARCEKLSEIPEKVDFFDRLPEYDAAFYTNKKSKTDSAVSLRMLEEALPVLEALPAWTNDSIHDALMELAAALGVKNATLMWPVRIAVSGRLVTPGGAVELCRILGRSETLRRLRIGMDRLRA